MPFKIIPAIRDNGARLHLKTFKHITTYIYIYIYFFFIEIQIYE